MQMSARIRGLMAGALASVLLLSPALALAGDEAASQGPDLSGTYEVKGQDAEGTQKYDGKVAVVKLGHTYRVDWALEDHRAVGTGILRAKTFAVTFVAPGLPVPGLAIFDLDDTGKLNGTFTLLGSPDVGMETWTPESY